MQITLIILGTLLLIGILYEQYARYKAKKNYPIKGAFVDVGGHELHYIKKGSGDNATIIFESGADFGGHVIWNTIQDKLSNNFTTLSYDRAGILHSQRGANPKNSESIAAELHTMVEKLDLPRPYIFVGHSLAGITLRYFVSKYPQDIAGIVLLDPSHPEMLEQFPEKLTKMQTAFPPKWLLSALLSIGLARFLAKNMIAKITMNPLASEIENYKEAIAHIDKNLTQGYADELYSLKQLTEETKGLEFANTPLILLGATKVPMKKEIYQQMIEVMTMLHHQTVDNSPDGKYVAVDSAHTIQAEQPDLVVDTVERFAKEVLKEKHS